MSPVDREADREAGHRLLLPGEASGPAAPAPAAAGPPSTSPPVGWSAVPWRTIVATIGLVVVAAATAVVTYRASRIVVWVFVAGFFAVVLSRPVRAVQARLHLRRGAAIGVVVGATLALVGGLGALFVLPVRTQLVAVLTDLPGTVEQAAQGQGPVGRVVTRLHLERLVRDNEPRLTEAARSLESSFPHMIRSVLDALFAVVTITVMTCLMLSQADALSRAGTKLVPIRHRARWARVATDAAGAISGYMIGNLVISLCAGVAAFALLLVLGVPSAIVLALWVAFADLIPLVGATIGAVVAVVAAFFVSPVAGIVAVVFFVLYQQFENSVLQVVVMARTVRVNPLAVLLSVLLGVELFGFVGALLAVPAAGAGGVVVKELWRQRPADRDALVVVTSGADAQERPAPTRPGWGRRVTSRLRPHRDATDAAGGADPDPAGSQHRGS